MSIIQYGERDVERSKVVVDAEDFSKDHSISRIMSNSESIMI